MIETMIAIILAPIALCAVVFLGCVVVGVGKGIKQAFTKKQH